MEPSSLRAAALPKRRSFLRRLHSTPALPGQGAPPTEALKVPGLWTARLELRSITPILGGGVHSFEPDVVDTVRVPGIRGQLRWWWRALFHPLEGESSAAADALFARESKLWGGVGVGGEGASDGPGLRSRVRVHAEIVKRGTVEPAGVHAFEQGRLKTLPNWTIGRGLAYALFPLQREKSERDCHAAKAPGRDMETGSVRTGLAFRLRVDLIGGASGETSAASDVQQVLGSIWAWLFLGGLGARTRRGFGALELASPIELDPAAGLDAERWKRLFAGPEESGVSGWLEELGRLASPVGIAWPFQILMGGPRTDVGVAHGEIVECLKTFRQARNVGREPGGERPGTSRWPEAHLLRALETSGAVFGAHAPPADVVEKAKSGQVGAPRAAFGLPIQMKFKDAADTPANATLQPANAKRWPSPLLLRPLRLAGGRYLPAAIFLPLPPPDQVEIEYDNDKKAKRSVPVARWEGARATIETYLKPAGGRALQAFAAWLVKERGYKSVSIAGRP